MLALYEKSWFVVAIHPTWWLSDILIRTFVSFPYFRYLDINHIFFPDVYFEEFTCNLCLFSSSKKVYKLRGLDLVSIHLLTKSSKKYWKLTAPIRKTLLSKQHQHATTLISSSIYQRDITVHKRSLHIDSVGTSESWS